MRFIAFSTVDLQPLACGATAQAALTKAIAFHRLDDPDYIEVLDCAENAPKVWRERLILPKARKLNGTVFRGPGYEPHIKAVPMMTATEFRAARHKLGLSCAALAKLFRLGANGGRTVRRWEAGDNDIPGPAQVLMDWLANGRKPKL